jgi:GNAT superfamily N-acetyltransferase
MAATEEPAIVRLDASDAPGGLILSSEAHWNQNDADWRFFLKSGVVFGMRDGSGRLIATAALLPYTAGNAWISMVLVTGDWQRRGLATRLVDRCLAAAAELKLTTWLDATPAGAAVYGPLGFAPTLELRRLRLKNLRDRRQTETVATYNLAEFIARDREAIGFDRSALLNELGKRDGSCILSNGEAVALIRDGRTARHIGPLFASTPDRALALIRGIASGEAGPLLLDAVASQNEFLNGLVESGWNIERPFRRMRFGAEAVQAAEPPFAVAGPEYG